MQDGRVTLLRDRVWRYPKTQLAQHRESKRRALAFCVDRPDLSSPCTLDRPAGKGDSYQSKNEKNHAECYEYRCRL